MLDEQNALQNTKCLKCGSQNFIEFSGECVVCADCGFVNGQNTSDNNDGEVDRRRKRTEQLTTILKIEENSMEKAASPNVYLNRVGLEELIKDLRVCDSIERNIALTLYEITKIAFALSLPGEVLKEAAHIYEELAKKCRFKGKPIKALGSAIVYLAGKKAGFPCSMREVAHSAGVPCNKIYKLCEFILEQLNETTFPENDEAYIRRVCSLLGVKGKTFEVADKTMLAINQSKYGNGKSLPGLVSASIYIASKLAMESVTQRQLAEATHVTEATIRTRCKDIIKNFLLILTV